MMASGYSPLPLRSGSSLTQGVSIAPDTWSAAPSAVPDFYSTSTMLDDDDLWDIDDPGSWTDPSMPEEEEEDDPWEETNDWEDPFMSQTPVGDAYPLLLLLLAYAIFKLKAKRQKRLDS